MALLKKKEFRNGNMSLVIDKIQKRKFKFFYNDEYAYYEIAIRNNKFLALYTTIFKKPVPKLEFLGVENLTSIVEIAIEIMREFNLKLIVSSVNFNFLYPYYVDELKDYWIGVDGNIYRNKERDAFL